jgi:hypothetical protein
MEQDRPRLPVPPLAAVVIGGVVAGVLDISFAWVFWAAKIGVALSRILQSVASGLLGKASFLGGAASAALGFALQLFIATAMSATYYAVARRWPLLVRERVACGAGYGLVLYGVMNYVVVPLSAARSGGPQDPLWVGLSIVAHVVLIGIPIGLVSGAAAGSARSRSPRAR